MAFTVQLEFKIPARLQGLKPLPMEGARRVAGRAVVNALREHFNRLDRDRPNQLGGARTHFYRQVARSVQQPRLEGEDVRVSINHVGAAQRFFGGVIRPTKAKYLTIPARAEAYGKRAREFNDLEILWGKRGPIALVQRNQTLLGKRRKKKADVMNQELREISYMMEDLGIKQEKQKSGFTRQGQEIGGGVFFWLVKAVTQKPDPTVLPTEAELRAAITPALQDYLAAWLSAKNSQP